MSTSTDHGRFRLEGMGGSAYRTLPLVGGEVEEGRAQPPRPVLVALQHHLGLFPLLAVPLAGVVVQPEEGGAARVDNQLRVLGAALAQAERGGEPRPHALPHRLPLPLRPPVAAQQQRGAPLRHDLRRRRALGVGADEGRRVGAVHQLPQERHVRVRQEAPPLVDVRLRVEEPQPDPLGSGAAIVIVLLFEEQLAVGIVALDRGEVDRAAHAVRLRRLLEVQLQRRQRSARQLDAIIRAGLR